MAKTRLQQQFENETPTIKGVSGKEYLQTFCAWLETQVEKLEEQLNPNALKKGEYGGYFETTTDVRFHHDHYMQVRRARKETLTLPDQADYGELGGGNVDHELLGTVLKNEKTGKEYIIDRVTRQWHCGWFLAVCARAKGTRSHALLYWENETCRLAYMQDLILDAQSRYKVIGKVDEEEIENF